jgi:hypothetical protein
LSGRFTSTLPLASKVWPAALVVEAWWKRAVGSFAPP